MFLSVVNVIFFWFTCYLFVAWFAIIFQRQLIFSVVISPSSFWVLSLMLPLDVIIFIITSPIFSLSWKRDTLVE